MAREPGRSRRPGEDALSSLAHDHRGIEALFKRVRKDPLLLSELQEELEIHARAEEEVFYPAVEQALGGEGSSLVAEARRQHQDMRERLGELDGLDRAAAEFAQALQELQAAVEQHIDEEEIRMFPRAEDAMAPEQLVELARRIKMVKDEMKSVLAQS
jgi:iron-sulfur cluster repair protein YtfE (RIC family)